MFLKSQKFYDAIYYLVGTPAGIDVFTERHELGLFTFAEYEEAMRDTELRVAIDPEGLIGRGLLIGQRPAEG